MINQEKIYKSFLNLKESTKKYPVTILLSIINFIFLIYYNEILSNSNFEVLPIQRYIKVLFILIPFSIFISNILKNRTKSQIKNTIFTLLFSFITFLIVNMFLKTQVEFRQIYILITFIFIGLLSIFIDTGRRYKYEYFLNTIMKSFFLTSIYSFILYLGLAAIIFTLNSLFNTYIDSKYYYYTFLFISLIFAVSMFLSKIPKEKTDSIVNSYSRALKILITYIIIPLLSIYTLILYVYLAKILITSNWPQGIVSHLILWFSVISILVLIYIDPIKKENKVLSYFNKLFPIIILPVYIMMFTSIGIRIKQYGLTENRYLVILLGIWSLLSMIFLILKKKSNFTNQLITISLIVFALISIVGPLSSFNISIKSQNKRLENILNKNDMLKEEKIVANPNLNKNSKNEINSSLSYFNSRGFENMNYVPNHFTIEDTSDFFGFEYKEDNNYLNSDKTIYKSLSTSKEEILDIKDYSYQIFLNINENDQDTTKIYKDIKLIINHKTLNIYNKDELIISQNIETKVKDLLLSLKEKDNLYDLSLEDTKIEFTNDNIEVLLIPYSIEFYKNNDDLTYEYMEIALYFKIK